MGAGGGGAGREGGGGGLGFWVLRSVCGAPPAAHPEQPWRQRSKKQLRCRLTLYFQGPNSRVLEGSRTRMVVDTAPGGIGQEANSTVVGLRFRGSKALMLPKVGGRGSLTGLKSQPAKFEPYPGGS